MRYLLILLIFAVMQLCAEVSVFGAGDLKSDNPYGLTESEKVIFAIKKSTLQNRRDIKSLKLQIADMREALEGVRSVVASLSEKVGETGQKLHEIASGPKEDTQRGEIEMLKSELAAQKAQNAKIMQALKKLTGMIESINSDYVSKSELDLSKKKVKTKKSRVAKTRDSKSKAKSNQALLKEAIKAYRAKRYDLAEKDFQTLEAKNYKRATSNYYLGEIAYYRKHYNDAIVYYKKSANLYDKATYMPTLLLHTALSFKHLGEEENARRFFEAVIASYPGTAQAKLAKKYL